MRPLACGTQNLSMPSLIEGQEALAVHAHALLVSISLHKPLGIKKQPHVPVVASPEKNGSMCASRTSTASRTFKPEPPSCWNEYCMSEMVMGMPSDASWSCAERTCERRSEGDRTPSRSGSEPNWTARVTNLALGFECSVAKSESRRCFHCEPPSKPNCA